MMRPILLVEDDPAIRALMRDVLLEEGYTVIAVEDGAHALAVMAEMRPSLILLDPFLPNENGLDFLAALKQRQGGDDIPIIVCSAVTPPKLPLGVIASLRKPFSLDALVATVKPYAHA